MSIIPHPPECRSRLTVGAYSRKYRDLYRAHQVQRDAVSLAAQRTLQKLANETKRRQREAEERLRRETERQEAERERILRERKQRLRAHEVPRPRRARTSRLRGSSPLERARPSGSAPPSIQDSSYDHLAAEDYSYWTIPDDVSWERPISARTRWTQDGRSHLSYIIPFNGRSVRIVKGRSVELRDGETTSDPHPLEPTGSATTSQESLPPKSSIDALPPDIPSAKQEENDGHSSKGFERPKHEAANSQTSTPSVFQPGNLPLTAQSPRQLPSPNPRPFSRLTLRTPSAQPRPNSARPVSARTITFAEKAQVCGGSLESLSKLDASRSPVSAIEPPQLPSPFQPLPAVAVKAQSHPLLSKEAHISESIKTMLRQDALASQVLTPHPPNAGRAQSALPRPGRTLVAAGGSLIPRWRSAPALSSRNVTTFTPSIGTSGRISLSNITQPHHRLKPHINKTAATRSAGFASSLASPLNATFTACSSEAELRQSIADIDKVLVERLTKLGL
ncbi:hypothetical protein BC832DRAFT_479655 [Gaertneriomyces semiglobifer]|nr:hypothetical protein BC832DRAFT_479655 [Gaertneriomyces semiglobifer]